MEGKLLNRIICQNSRHALSSSSSIHARIHVWYWGRVERFGLAQGTLEDNEAKKKARLARFAPSAKMEINKHYVVLGDRV